MEPNKWKEEYQRKTIEETEDAKKARRYGRIWKTSAPEAESGREAAEKAAVSTRGAAEAAAESYSWCPFCEKKISDLENHYEEPECIGSWTFCREDCNQECCENSENTRKSDNLCSQQCGKECCIPPASICKKCFCIGCCEDLDKNCRNCECNDSCKSIMQCLWFQKDTMSKDNRALSGNSEENLEKVDQDLSKTKTESPSEDVKKIYKSVLEEMKEKVTEKNTNKSKMSNEKKSSEKEHIVDSNNMESAEKFVQNEDERSVSKETDQAMDYNWWYPKSNIANTDMSKETPTQQGQNSFLAWWNSESTRSDKSNKVIKENNPSNPSSKNHPKSPNISPEVPLVNRNEETCLTRVLNLLISLTGGNENQEESWCTRIINFFYGLFQIPIDESSVDHSPNPGVINRLPSAFRRRNASNRNDPATDKEEGNKFPSWMNQMFSRKNK